MRAVAYNQGDRKGAKGMDMGYVILVALIVLPLSAAGVFLMLLITGVFHEAEGAEAAAMGYGHSWKRMG
jgi:hypothetical protein